jgi:hypothetical protein
MRRDTSAIGWRVLLTGLILVVMVLPSGGIGFGVLGMLMVLWGGTAVFTHRSERRTRPR